MPSRSSRSRCRWKLLRCAARSYARKWRSPLHLHRNPQAKPKPLKLPRQNSFQAGNIETNPQHQVGNTREEIQVPESVVEPPPPLASLPEKPGSGEGGWNAGGSPDEAEGSAGGAGNLFDKGDVGVVGGTGVEGGGGGEGTPVWAWAQRRWGGRRRCELGRSALGDRAPSRRLPG